MQGNQTLRLYTSLVKPYDDPRLIAAQGTIGLEIIEKINTFIIKHAKRLGITQEALATKKDILLLVQGRESRLNVGWRKSQLNRGIKKILKQDK